MPEAVSAWYQFKDSSILERVEKVTKIHADLVEGYRRDFGKYAGKVDATLIESVFNSIPASYHLSAMSQLNALNLSMCMSVNLVIAILKPRSIGLTAAA